MEAINRGRAAIGLPPDTLRQRVDRAKALAEAAPKPGEGDTDRSVRDLVLDCLRSAGAVGVKASRIRGEIEAQRSTKLHDKTIGMTLYRLSQAKPPQARREGTTWFFVPHEAETKNPGGETPGLDNSSNDAKGD